jgi:hypothetical protein
MTDPAYRPPSAPSTRAQNECRDVNSHAVIANVVCKEKWQAQSDRHDQTVDALPMGQLLDDSWMNRVGFGTLGCGARSARAEVFKRSAPGSSSTRGSLHRGRLLG